MRWFWDTSEADNERVALRTRYPALSLNIDRPGRHASLSGVITVAPGIGYWVTIEIPSQYPTEIPLLRCKSEEIPILADRHFDVTTGAACLCARAEYRMHWPTGSLLADFIDRLVLPFLASQYYFDAHGKWPPTGQRAHGLAGIIEAYQELAGPFGNTNKAALLRLAELLARTSEPKGHEICPCGSNRKLRSCHRDQLRALRSQIDPKHVLQDLRAMRIAFSSVRAKV